MLKLSLGEGGGGGGGGNKLGLHNRLIGALITYIVRMCSSLLYPLSRERAGVFQVWASIDVNNS